MRWKSYSANRGLICRECSECGELVFVSDETFLPRICPKCDATAEGIIERSGTRKLLREKVVNIGHWFLSSSTRNSWSFSCSVCSDSVTNIHYYNLPESCPNCRAKLPEVKV